MSGGQSPFAPPPPDTPGALPPNRGRPGSARMALVWVVLIVVFVAAYQVLTPRADAPVRAPAGGSPLGWSLPGAVYGAMIVGLLVLRGRLPARYRTGEVRERLRPPAPAPPVVEATSIDLTLEGEQDGRAVTLRFTDEGVWWHARARLLTPPQELRIAWGELEQVRTYEVSRSPIVLWLGLVALVGAVASPPLRVGLLVAAVVCVVLWALARARRLRGLTITTATHVLHFHSRALEAPAVALIEAAVRARAPRAAPAPPQATQGVLGALLVTPLRQLVRALGSSARVRAEVYGAHVPADAEVVRAGELQWRMYHLWTGVLCGAGPIAMGAGAALATAQWSRLWMGWVFAWAAGLFVWARGVPLFARFAGMELLK